MLMCRVKVEGGSYNWGGWEQTLPRLDLIDKKTIAEGTEQRQRFPHIS